MHGAKKSRARAREARKMHFCTPGRVFAHAHYKLEFGDAERQSGCNDDSRKHKFTYCLHIQKMRSKNKVALAVELSIVCSFCDIFFQRTIADSYWIIENQIFNPSLQNCDTTLLRFENLRINNID